MKIYTLGIFLDNIFLSWIILANLFLLNFDSIFFGKFRKIEISENNNFHFNIFNFCYFEMKFMKSLGVSSNNR